MATEAQSTRRKRSLLAGVMLAVLVASVGVAWVLGELADRRVKSAVATLAAVRRDGLGKHWPERLRVDWYLSYAGDEAEPSGWGASIRGRGDQGPFAGMMLRVTGHEYTLEQWLLNADATSGDYDALKGVGWPLPDTSVTLEKGEDGEKMDVTVTPYGGKRLPGRAPAPKNYLPEGTLELAVALVAAGRGNAQFALVFNESPNVGGRIEFGTVRMRYAGKGPTRQGKETRRVRVGFGGRRQDEHEYEVGPDGEVLAWSEPGRRFVAVGEEELRGRFPNALSIVGRLLPNRLRIIWQRERMGAPPDDESEVELEVRSAAAFAVLLAQLGRAADQLVVVGQLELLELEVGRALNAVSPRGEFAEKVERRNVVHGRLDVDAGVQRLVAVEADDDLVVAVPGEVEGGGRPALLVIGDEHQCVGRIGGDGECPLHAARAGQREHAGHGGVEGSGGHGAALIHCGEWLLKGKPPALASFAGAGAGL